MNAEATLIALVVGVLVPQVTAAVTKDNLSTRLKALITTGLATVAGALTGWQTTPPAGWGQWQNIVWTIGLGWLGAGVIYFTGYNPQKIGVAATVSRATDGFGIGPSQTTTLPPAQENPPKP